MKKVLNYIILIGLLGLTSWILIYNNDFSNFPQLISKTNKFFLLWAFSCMVLFWICDAYIIHKMRKTLNIKGHFRSSFTLAMIGQYYSAITPFATGGQPAQIYYLANQGVQLGVASSLMITKFLIYQLVVTFYSIFMFIIKFNFLVKEAKFFLPFIMIGCLLNFLALLIIIGFFFNEKLIKKIFHKFFIIAYKLKLIKDIKKHKDRLSTYLMDFAMSINSMREDKKTASALILVTFLQLIFYFSITYFVYLAVGLDKVLYLDIIAIQSLHYMAVSFMPTPGSVGAAEGGFYMLYKSIFPIHILTFAMLLWRFIDYYFGILIGGFFTLVNFIQEKSKKIKN